jgi:hypothetical protein
MTGAVVPRRVLTAALVLGLAVTGVLALAAPCLACSCAPSTPEQAFRRADAAFVGRVVNDVMIETGTTQTFEVEQVFKGQLGPTVDVWAQIGTTVVNSCAIVYPTSDRVAVLLYDDGEGHWSAQACSQVTEAELRRVGGPPREPVEQAAPEPDLAAPAEDLRADRGGGLPTWIVIALGAILAVAVVWGQITWAARRDRRAAFPSGWDPVDADESQEVEP